MPRDYVKRSPAPKKRAGAKRGATKKAPAKSPAPKLMLGLALLLIAGFGYLLFTISGSADSSDTPPAKIELDGKPQPPKESKPLPPKPTEQWSYIKELENKEVEVEVPDAPTNTRPYLMQCASFRSLQQAEELKARIAFQGLESEVRASQGSNGTWYKVILGPYPTKRLAEKDRHLLQRDNIQGCQIWYW